MSVSKMLLNCNKQREVNFIDTLRRDWSGNRASFSVNRMPRFSCLYYTLTYLLTYLLVHCFVLLQFLTRPSNSNKNFPYHVRTSQVCYRALTRSTTTTATTELILQ